MHRRVWLAAILWAGLAAAAGATGPADSVVGSEQVLNELMAIPARQIPRTLLAQAQGIVIVPNVIKIGFIGGGRRGHGVVLVRDAEGEWSLPQFVTLTGGSVGFQAGIQGSDVVLVFTTPKGVEGLMRGKFTIGLDASASAGPIGRDAAVGTDATLLSEIYSYSRSRGLFLGVALDGSVLEIDHASLAAYYGTPSGQMPAQVPKAADDLRRYLSDLTPRIQPGTSGKEPVSPISSPRVIEGLRRSLIQHAGQLHAQLSPDWRRYLGLPQELEESGRIPSTDTLSELRDHYANVASKPEYQQLAQHPEFQRTYELIIEYEKAIAATHPILQLPPPPPR
jgi:lipid-binding SYLF domain-containing protein